MELWAVSCVAVTAEAFGGWLNHPLVQLPWFHYLPPALKNSAGEVFFTGLLFLALFFGHQVLSRLRSLEAR